MTQADDQTPAAGPISVKTPKHSRLTFALAFTLLGAAALTTAMQRGAIPSRPQGPCDIYGAAGTPCVAAHSTTRALYASYNGPLYQVKRQSDGRTLDIGVVQPVASPVPDAGGYADAAAQDAFCANTLCVINLIYDQSGKGNHLYQAPPGPLFPGPAKGAIRHPADRGHGAHHDRRPQGLRRLHHAGHGVPQQRRDRPRHRRRAGGHLLRRRRHALRQRLLLRLRQLLDERPCRGHRHHGDHLLRHRPPPGAAAAGPGPWIMADMEAGLFSGYDAKQNVADPTIDSWRFVTAVVDGGGGNKWDLRGGNAQKGGLTTFYSGVRPGSPTSNAYYPMHKQGAILLGIGGDNGNGSSGTFYEGVMTTGYPTEATTDAVQANIVAARYDVQRVEPVAGDDVHAGIDAGRHRDVHEHDGRARAWASR